VSAAASAQLRERDVPTSLEALKRHRARNARADASRQVWLFHSHVYFDHTAPERVAEARAFRDLMRTTFAENAHVEVNSFFAAPGGPHPRGNFEVLFTRAAFADFVSWLMFARPECLDVLVHPLTRSQTLDHTTRTFWLGTPHSLDRGFLEKVDARLRATGTSEESIIEGTKRH
jgi:aromatic ring-cleaving dioxygenase